MKPVLSLILAIACLPGLASAQEYRFASAFIQGVGGVSALTVSSPSIASANPALLEFGMGHSGAELSYRQLFGLSELEDFALHGRQRIGRANAAFSVARFGETDLYQEYTLAFGASHRLRQAFAIGAALEYSSVEFGDGQSRYAGASATLSAGWHPTASFIFSVSARRLTLDQVYDDYHYDPVYEGSVGWTASEVSLGAMWTRERPGEHRFALGQILRLTRNFDFTSGLKFDPVRYALGGRALYRQISVLYAYEGHPELGSTHSFGLAWKR